MGYHKRIETLQESVRVLTGQLQDATLSDQRRKELSEQLSQYQGEIRRLTRLQWEEDTQRVDLDDRY